MWQAYISQIARLAQSHSLRACCLAFWIRVSQVLFDMRSHSLSSHTSQTKDATDSGRTTMVLDCSNFFATAVMMQRRFSKSAAASWQPWQRSLSSLRPWLFFQSPLRLWSVMYGMTNCVISCRKGLGKHGSKMPDSKRVNCVIEQVGQSDWYRLVTFFIF